MFSIYKTYLASQCINLNDVLQIEPSMQLVIEPLQMDGSESGNILFFNSTPSQEYGPLLASSFPWDYNDDIDSVDNETAESGYVMVATGAEIESHHGGGGVLLLESENIPIEMTPAANANLVVETSMNENNILEEFSMELGMLRMLGKRRRRSSDDDSDVVSTLKKESRK